MLHLNYKSYGSGGAVIILHGLLGSLNNWQTMGKVLARYFKVYAVDQRNHGRSPHAEAFNYNVMADDIKNFMHERRIPSARLIGHSMGGKTAMQLALSHPELVERLVVADIAPKTYPPKHDLIFDALCALDLRSYAERKEVDKALQKRITEKRVREFLLMNLTRSEYGEFRWKVNLRILSNHYREISAAVRGDRTFAKPTLFVKGSRSSYIEKPDRAFIKQLFPTSRIISIHGAGHWIHADKPEEFSQAVLHFLIRP